MRVNQGQFKPGTNKNLSWQKPVPSDNLVITFSDDDSGTDSGKTRQDALRGRKATPQEHRVTTEVSGQIHNGSATKFLPHHKGIEVAVVPVGHSPSAVLAQRPQPQPQPGEKNADQNTRLLSLLEREELQEKELENAQEHRRKCEVEEREALRAYREAQRALLEANERCTILRRKREICSAQVHGLIAENSSLVQPLSIQNIEDGIAMPSLLNSQIHANSQMPENEGGRHSLHPEEPPQQPVDKHEALPHSSRYDNLVASTADPNFVSTANDNNMPLDYMDDDLLFPASQARSERALDLENQMEETIHAYAENIQASGDSVQDYELLEASLRSRLVERFGKKPCLNCTSEGTEEVAVGNVVAEHGKQSAHNKTVQGSVDVELFLEGALDLYCGKVNKPDRIKALLFLARSIEADPSTVILWVFYLHIYYQKDEGLGKDDMFSDAVHYLLIILLPFVQHNVYSYELWLMYINSRLRFDDRLDAYNDALSMLCQMTADTDKDLKERSAFILDIFLQMIYFLCMSGNVERAISRIFGILPTATPDNSGDKLLADVISCLTMPDRCVFWISCLYVSIYRKLPEEIVDQLEFQKALPRSLVWSPIDPNIDNRNQIIELLNYAAYKMAEDISECVKNGDPSYLMLSQFLAVNHTSCLAAVEGFKSSADMLVKYMKEYPMCPQILLISARLDRNQGAYPDLKGFHELILNWPKEVQGVQYLWNQYFEHALAADTKLAEKLLNCWFEEYAKDCDVQSNAAVGAVEFSNEEPGPPSLVSVQEVGSGPSASEDHVFWLLNLSLYKLLEDDLHEAQVAVDKALKLAHGECYEHCLREHAAIHLLELEKSSSSLDAQTRSTFSFIIGHLADHRNLPTRELLSRRFCQNVKRHRLRQLIDDTIGPVPSDSTLVNSILEVCFGPSLLPGRIGDVKYLVDFVETVVEVLPANYRLALAVGQFIAKHYRGSDATSMGTRFWASSVLINTIFRAVPVAPESVWLEGASLLEKLQTTEIVKRFYQQATSVYPFSFKLWDAHLNSCKASGGNAEGIVESARQRGIELNMAPT
nr:unnamed protein product [Digitaria exilis]